MAILLAVYTATNGIGAIVALEVTFTNTPDLHSWNRFDVQSPLGSI
jgi:hypothetical protein